MMPLVPMLVRALGAPGRALAAPLAITAAAAMTPALLAAERAPVTIDSVVLRPLVEAEVPARQTGVLARIAVAEGQAVAEGDLLAMLDDRSAQLAVRHAESERAQAEMKARNELSLQYADKALEVARAELERSEQSNRQFPSSISRSQLDVERLTIEKLELERQQAAHELELARYDLEVKSNACEAAQLELDLHAVRAPFAGVASLVRANVGEWVEPSAVVVRLVAVDRLRAEGFAPADAVDQSMLGAEVRFTPALQGEGPPTAGPLAPSELSGAAPRPRAGAVTGRLAFISPEVDPVTGQVRIWAEINNAARQLHPGQQGQLELNPEEREGE